VLFASAASETRFRTTFSTTFHFLGNALFPLRMMQLCNYHFDEKGAQLSRVVVITWYLSADGLSRSQPFGSTCDLRAVAEAGTSLVVCCSSLVEICLIFFPGRRLLIFCWTWVIVALMLVYFWLNFICVLSSYWICYCFIVHDFTHFWALCFVTTSLLSSVEWVRLGPWVTLNHMVDLELQTIMVDPERNHMVAIEPYGWLLRSMKKTQ